MNSYANTENMDFDFDYDINVEDIAEALLDSSVDADIKCYEKINKREKK